MRHGSPPASLLVRIDPGTLVLDDGRLLIGGAPSRLVRVKPAAAALIKSWRAGGPVGELRGARALARRLLDAGLLIPDPMQAATARLAVVVPVHGRVAQLERCLEAICASAPGVEVLVVDDGSPDPGALALLATKHGARLVRQPVRRGPAAARNAGLAHTDAPLVAFVDSDVAVDRACLGRLVGHFDDPATGAVAPRVLAARGEAGLVSGYEARHSSLDMGARPGRVWPVAPIPYLPAATLVVRRAAAGKGFDEELSVGEDVDFVWRVAKAGWNVWYDPAVTVRHEHRATLREFVIRRFAYASSIGPLARRHPEALPAVRVDLGTGAIALLILRRPWAAVAVGGVLVARVYGMVRGRARQPASMAAALAPRASIAAVRGVAFAVRRPWWPLFAIAALRSRRATAVLGGSVTVGLFEKRVTRPSDAALAVLDDLIAGAGTWWSCARHRTAAPLLPARRQRAVKAPSTG